MDDMGNRTSVIVERILIGLMILVLFWALAAGAAHSTEVGVSVLEHRARHNTGEASRGFDVRLNFGDRGRWALAVGKIRSRSTGDVDNWITAPFGCCAYAEELPEYSFVNLTHRWFARPFSWMKRADLDLFGGVGLAYREGAVCVDDLFVDGVGRYRTAKTYCWKGTAEVDSSWSFHLSAGVRWRDVIELAVVEHDSTAKISDLNKGDDVVRLSFLASIGASR